MTELEKALRLSGDMLQAQRKLEREKLAMEGAIISVRDGYLSQMKFCDIEAMGYFREFVRRINDALAKAKGDGEAHDMTKVVGYRAGEDRNEAAYGRRSTIHTYAMMDDDELWPMCGYGWNRSGGTRFSILRHAPGTEGDCKLCEKNVAAGKAPVMDGFPHKTKWL